MYIEASNSYLKDLVEIAVNIINKKATIISQLDLNQMRIMLTSALLSLKKDCYISILDKLKILKRY